MSNKRIEMAQKAGSALAIIVYCLAPFYFFLFVDTVINAAGGYLIGFAWTILGLAVFIWFIDGDKENDNENKKTETI